MIPLAQLPAYIDRALPEDEQFERLPSFYKALVYAAPGKRRLTDAKAKQIAHEVCAMRAERRRQGLARPQ